MGPLTQHCARGIGAALWLAAVEIVLVARQQYVPPSESARTPDPSYEVVVALAYACAGGLLAALVALLLPKRFSSADRSRALVALLLVVAIDAAAWNVAPWRRDWVTHGLAALLALLAFATLTGRAARPWTSLLHPLSITLLLLGPSIVVAARPGLEGGALLLPLFLAIAAVAGASLLLGRLRWPAWTAAAAPVLAAVLAIVVSGRLQPPIPAQHPLTSAAASAGAWNILLVTLDTVRADHTSLYGYERDTTPNLAALAADGIVFERAYSAADHTLPSHATLFTGVPPRTHGVRAGPAGESSWTHALADRFETLAEQLSEQGFSTWAVVANSRAINTRLGLAQGFGYLDSRPGPASDGGADARLPRHAVAPLLAKLGLRDRAYRDAAEIRRATLRALDAARHAEPFFLFVNWMDAHFPYTPPEPYASLFPGRDESSRLHLEMDEHERVQSSILTGQGELDPRDRAHLVSQYDGGIAYVDAELGRVFDRLRELGLDERTIVLVTADHGEAFGEHGALGHGVASVYEEMVHVPAVLRVPGARGALRDPAPVRTSAIAALLPELATRKTPAPGALVAAVDHQSVVAEAYPESWLMEERSRFQRPSRALVSGQHKLIRTRGQPLELYDLERDPREQATRGPDTGPGSALLEKLQNWLERNPDGAAETAAVDDETAAALRELGYFVDPGAPGAPGESGTKRP